MKRDLAGRQAKMKLYGAAPVRIVTPRSEPLTPETVPVEYTSGVSPLHHTGRMSGVYILTEDGRYYIGQSIDVPARFASHRLNPMCCHFKDPRGALLSSVLLHDNWTWKQNNQLRLQAEDRFIAAALQMGVPLTNTLSGTFKEKLIARFPDLNYERERIAEALKILC